MAAVELGGRERRDSAAGGGEPGENMVSRAGGQVAAAGMGSVDTNDEEGRDADASDR
jgi:hypothetical protein